MSDMPENIKLQNNTKPRFQRVLKRNVLTVNNIKESSKHIPFSERKMPKSVKSKRANPWDYNYRSNDQFL